MKQIKGNDGEKVKQKHPTRASRSLAFASFGALLRPSFRTTLLNERTYCGLFSTI